MVTLVLNGVTLPWYLSGVDIQIYLSMLIQLRWNIDATPHKMSIQDHSFLSQTGKTQLGPVERYAAHIGIENSATSRSVNANDTTKWFVTLRIFRNIEKADMTRRLPTTVRTMITIRNDMERSFNVKSKSLSGVGRLVLACVVEVEFILFYECRKKNVK